MKAAIYTALVLIDLVVGAFLLDYTHYYPFRIWDLLEMIRHIWFGLIAALYLACYIVEAFIIGFLIPLLVLSPVLALICFLLAWLKGQH